MAQQLVAVGAEEVRSWSSLAATVPKAQGSTAWRCDQLVQELVMGGQVGPLGADSGWRDRGDDGGDAVGHDGLDFAALDTRQSKAEAVLGVGDSVQVEPASTASMVLTFPPSIKMCGHGESALAHGDPSSSYSSTFNRASSRSR